MLPWPLLLLLPGLRSLLLAVVPVLGSLLRLVVLLLPILPAVRCALRSLVVVMLLPEAERIFVGQPKLDPCPGHGRIPV